MEKNKNVLIGGLLAIVLVMAVGYAAFATQLNISGTATVDSKWDVHFDTSVTSGTATAATGVTAGTTNTPTAGTVSYDGNTATIADSKLYQPGDIVTWTLKVQNEGTIDAKTSGITVTTAEGKTGTTGGDATSGYTVTSANGAITYTVKEITSKTIAANTTTGGPEIEITAVYNDVKTDGQSASSYEETTGVKITVDWEQA